jgi:hypothetical protein
LGTTIGSGPVVKARTGTAETGRGPEVGTKTGSVLVLGAETVSEPEVEAEPGIAPEVGTPTGCGRKLESRQAAAVSWNLGRLRP